MDIASIGGIALAVIGILAGMMIEGGSIAQITQPTAAMIVIGGTAGAVMLQFPLSIFLAALKDIVKVFLHKGSDGEAVLAQLVAFANKARKSGIVSLDGDLATVTDPFLKQALMLAVDGTEPSEVRKIMQLELDNKSEIEEKIPAVFEAAGGYSPTVGIIGAVLGLIQVMKNLANIDEVGRGIATAFVATIYGVAVANLICLPAAGKLKFRHREEQMIKEMILEGVISILEGMNPRMIETKLRTYLFDSKPSESSSAKRGHRMSYREKTSRARKPRALARLLRRLHHPPLRLLRRPLRLQSVRQEKADQTSRGHADRLHPHGRLRGPLQNTSHSSTAAASPPAPHPSPSSHRCPQSTKQQQHRSISTKRSPLNPPPHNYPPAASPCTPAIRASSSLSTTPASSPPVQPKSVPKLSPLSSASPPASPPAQLRIEGHTDNIPIHTAQFASNWELSTARASRIARLLLEYGNTSPADLSASGYAEFHPVASNATPEGRLQNRRVDIILLRHPAPSQ